MNSRWLFAIIAAFSFSLGASSVYFIWRTPYVITPEDLAKYRTFIDEARNGPATVPLSKYVSVIEGVLEFRTKALATQRAFFKVLKWSSVSFFLIGLSACAGWWYARSERAT